MRADRLLSILMILQARGRMTAQELAEDLEVSVRTIYRDIDALSVAGIPIYTERGPGGGCALLDSYRTTLTGLTRHEVRALFMLSIPAPLAELGVGQDLRAALLKLSAALPVAHRQDEERVRQRIHLDAVDWFHAREPVHHLKTIQQAVWQDRRLLLTYHLPFETRVERLVDPYGLVAKASIWYLVCARDGHIRVHRVSHVLEARLADGCFERSTDFDLVAFWKGWCAKVEANRPSYPVSVRVSEDLVPFLPRFFGHGMRALVQETGPPDAEGWVRMTLPFESLEDARSRILGFGAAMEVLEPQPLRESVLDFALQITARYRG
jgi:predicted DNA-binding transcriptional regulator YafY